MFERRQGVVIVAAMWIGIAGCGRTRPEGSPTPAKPGPEEAFPAAPTAGDSEADPADALNRLVIDLAAGRGDAVFAALPPQYREDIDRMFATRIRPADASARRKAAEAVARFAETLAGKERFVLVSERFEITGPAAEVIRAHFGAICRIVATTARWQGRSEAAGGDSRALTAAIASAVSKDADLATELKSLRFVTASRAGARATLTVAGGGERRQLTVVRIGDAWVPATVADRWDSLFGDGSASQERISSEELASLAERLDELSGTLSGVATQAEFDSLVDHAATLLLATAAQSDREPRAVSPDEFVTVEVFGRMTDAQKDQVVWELTTLTDPPHSGIADAADRADGEGLVVTVGPVTDLTAFSQGLTGLKVETVDAEKKTVRARFIGP